jgi:hypothetical protein
MKPFALDNCKSRVVVFGHPGNRNSRNMSSRRMRKTNSGPSRNTRNEDSQWEDYDDDEPDEEELEREVGVGKFILVISKSRGSVPKNPRTTRASSYRVNPPTNPTQASPNPQRFQQQQQVPNDRLGQPSIQNKVDQTKLEPDLDSTKMENQALRNPMTRGEGANEDFANAMAEKEMVYKQLKIKEAEEKLKRLKMESDRNTRERNLTIDYERSQLNELLQKKKDESIDLKGRPPVPAKLGGGGGDNQGSRYNHRRGPSEGGYPVDGNKFYSDQTKPNSQQTWDFSGVNLSTNSPDQGQFQRGDEEKFARMEANFRKMENLGSPSQNQNGKGRSYSLSDTNFKPTKNQYGMKGVGNQSGFGGQAYIQEE